MNLKFLEAFEVVESMDAMETVREPPLNETCVIMQEGIYIYNVHQFYQMQGMYCTPC